MHNKSWDRQIEPENYTKELSIDLNEEQTTCQVGFVVGLLHFHKPLIWDFAAAASVKIF